jgi:hypothetical protein
MYSVSKIVDFSSPKYRIPALFPYERHPVAGEESIFACERQVFGERLGNQHAVERIPVPLATCATLTGNTSTEARVT